MSRSDFFKTAVISSVLIVFIVLWTSGSSYSVVSMKPEASLLSGNLSSKFTSSDEFVLHTNNSGSCLTEQCHIEFQGRGWGIHEPVSSGKCAECHNAILYPNKFGLERNQRNSCANCHKNMEQEIRSSKSVHGPIKNGDCTSCHDPHDSDQPFLLRQSYNELCVSCHKLASFSDKRFLHKPVKDGRPSCIKF
jgi:predicted CXXCH cytochrome family protein